MQKFELTSFVSYRAQNKTKPGVLPRLILDDGSIDPRSHTTRRLSAPKWSMVVDRNSLHGSTMVGYQGWFNCPNDSMGLGWKHWAKDKTKPVAVSNCVVDFLPDVSEFDTDELCMAADMKNANGESVQLFSSANRKTVLRHFQWMHSYGLDGIFLQRFGNGLHDQRYLQNYNTVLDNVISGAEQYGRTFVIMYDISGMKSGTVYSTIYGDWNNIEERVLTQSSRYQFHNKKPLVAIWGIGFKDRPYSLEECHRLVEALTNRGCSIMLGLPTGWREFKRDSVTAPFLHEIVQLADIVSPWSKYNCMCGASQLNIGTPKSCGQVSVSHGSENPRKTILGPRSRMVPGPPKRLHAGCLSWL